MERPRAKALSIVGAGRSGTTILANVLEEVPGIVGAGELRWLWSRDLPQQRLCGCGAPPATCEVWSEVVLRSMGAGPDAQDAPEFRASLQRTAGAQRDMSQASRRWALLSSPRSGRPLPPAQELVTRSSVAVLQALLEVCHGHVVVDASKRPQEAAVLARSGAFDHYVVHIVRDPRAVVHSWQRAKPLPASTGRTAMETRSPRKTVWRWLENAAGAEVLRRHVPADRWLFLRYEEFATRPRESVRRVLDLIGEPGEPPFVDDTTVQLGPNHNLSGNPSRFRTGPVRIVPDRRWVRAMPPRQQAAVTAATLPFLLRYGYPLVPAASAE